MKSDACRLCNSLSTQSTEVNCGATGPNGRLLATYFSTSGAALATFDSPKPGFSWRKLTASRVSPAPGCGCGHSPGPGPVPA